MLLLEKYIVSVLAVDIVALQVRLPPDYVVVQLGFVVQDWQYVPTAVLVVIVTGIRISLAHHASVQYLRIVLVQQQLVQTPVRQMVAAVGTFVGIQATIILQYVTHLVVQLGAIPVLQQHEI
jgi:hypothetical protein